MAHDPCDTCGRDIEAHESGMDNRVQIWQHPSQEVRMVCSHCAEKNEERENEDD